MKKLFLLILVGCFLLINVNLSALDCWTWHSKAGQAGTWTEGSCYGESDACSVTTCFDDDGGSHVIVVK